MAILNFTRVFLERQGDPVGGKQLSSERLRRNQSRQLESCTIYALLRAAQCPSMCPREKPGTFVPPKETHPWSVLLPIPVSTRRQGQKLLSLSQRAEERENLLLPKRAHSLSQRQRLGMMTSSSPHQSPDGYGVGHPSLLLMSECCPLARACPWAYLGGEKTVPRAGLNGLGWGGIELCSGCTPTTLLL